MKKLIFALLSSALCLPAIGQSNAAEELDFAQPLQLLTFTSSIQNQVVHLNWSTAWEKEFDDFTVERAGNDMAFKVIGKLKGKGHPDEQSTYDFIDNFPLEGQNYYRLKSTGLDGNMEYYPIISTYFDGLVSSNIDIFPNMVREHYLKLASESLVMEIKLFDLHGQMVYSCIPKVDTEAIHISEQVKPGTYLLVLLNDQGKQHQQQIMIL